MKAARIAALMEDVKGGEVVELYAEEVENEEKKKRGKDCSLMLFLDFFHFFQEFEANYFSSC